MSETESRPVSTVSDGASTSPVPPTKPGANNNNGSGPNPTDSSFEQNFRAFAKFGECKSTGDAITLTNSDKWFKQAKVIDGKKITTVDTGIYFKKIAK